ncbi:MAG: epoxyqueuosine reductase QueH [Lachnospiraceae bacterium]|nr:epoxyqueuosine reductase QueH [Lachnospiraceae bacterium]
MNNKNYAKLCEEELSKPDMRGKTLVLQSCCAPCSSWVLTYLQNRINIKSIYYNPNIVDEEEYAKREAELKRLVDILNAEYPGASIEFVKGKKETEKFLKAAKGYENEPEGGKRCELCYEIRLKEAARLAKEIKADYFSTTLTISPLKKASLINEIGERIAKEEGVAFLPSDFKKNDGYKKSVELSKKYGLYRQNYCGCPFSKRNTEHEETT